MLARTVSGRGKYMQDPASLIHTLLHQLSAVISRESDQILQEQLGIGLAQFKILSTLHDNPATQQNQIALTLGQTEASISRQIKLLRGKGLLETKIRPQNRRQHETILTPRGRQLIEAAQQVLASYQQQSLEHMPLHQQAQLLELLSKSHL